MKYLFFFNILISFFSLSSCHQDFFIEKPLPLKATDTLNPFLSSANFLKSNKDSTFVCQYCSNSHPSLNHEAYQKYNYSPVFIGKLEHLIGIKDPLGDVNSYLKNITNKEDAFRLYATLYHPNFGKYEYIDENWYNFNKIIFIKKELPNLALSFNQITRSLEGEEENQKNRENQKAYPIYLYYYICTKFRAVEQQINNYNKRSIDSLKGDKKFIELLNKSLESINNLFSLNNLDNRLSLIKTNQERENLFSLKKDIKLFKEFFKQSIP